MFRMSACIRMRSARSDLVEDPMKSKGSLTVYIGAVWLMATIAAWETPGVFVRASLSRAHGLCGSSVGTFGQLVSAGVRQDCGNVSTYTTLLLISAAGAVATAAYGVWKMRRPA